MCSGYGNKQIVNVIISNRLSFKNVQMEMVVKSNRVSVIKAIHKQPRVKKQIPCKMAVPGAWKQIVSVESNLITILLKLMLVLVGPPTTMLWFNWWGALKNHFPNLFELECEKICLIPDLFEMTSDEVIWHWRWRWSPV